MANASNSLDWAKLIKQNASQMDPSQYVPGATFPPEMNLALAANQQAQNTNPAFDIATLSQPQRGVQAAVDPSSDGGSGGGGILPDDKAFGYMPTGTTPGSQRKSLAEQQIYTTLKNMGNNPSLDAQKQSIDDYKTKLQTYMDRQNNLDPSAKLNLAPLAALADSWSGSKLSQAYTPPETDQERQAKGLMLQNQLAGLQGNLTKEQTALLRDKLTTLVGMDRANKEGGVSDTAQFRVDNMLHKTTTQNLLNDPTIVKLASRANNMTNAFSAFNNAELKTPQQLMELQQAFRNNLGIQGTSGLTERDASYFKNLGLKAADVEQWLFSKPVDIGPKEVELVDHLKDLYQIEMTNMRSQASQRAETIGASYGTMYGRPQNAGLKQDLNTTKSGVIKQFDPAVMAPLSNKTKNTKFDDMTDEQIQELYKKKMGK